MMKTLNKIIILLTMLITFSAGTAFAENTFSLKEETAIEPGTYGTLEFVLKNDAPFYGFQAKVTLSGALEFVTKPDGKPELELTDRTQRGGYQLISNPLDANNKEFLMAAFSSSNPQVAISGEDGVLVTLKVYAHDNFDGGSVTISDIKFVGDGDKDIALGNTTTEIWAYPKAVSISPSVLSLKAPNLTEILTADITPLYEKTVTTLTWSMETPEGTIIDNPEIASFEAINNEQVKVTSLSRGTTIIRATTKNGKSATCTVVVGQPAEEIILDPTTHEMKVGEEFHLSATVLPENTENKTVLWKSGNEEFATVDDYGNVIAKGLGEVEIIATALTGEGVEAICTITVIPTPAESVTVTPNPVELKVGETQKLSYEVLPDDATDKSVTWSSSDDSIATVDNEGVVTAIALGEATITATCGSVAGSSKITVVPTPVTAITVSPTEVELFVGDKRVLTAEVQPSDATDKSTRWESSDESVATVSQEGEITAISPGKAVITVSSQEVSATCNVTVLEISVESISVVPEELSMTVGDPAIKLETTILPENATFKTVTWNSSDESIATVSENGEVTPVGAGTANITATTNNGKTAACMVTVNPKIIDAESISLDKSTLQLTVEDIYQLIATVLPEDATDKTVAWTSSDPNIASVDNSGLVTAMSAGTAIVTASCGNHAAECTVTVIPKVIDVTGISLDKSTLQLTEEETYNLTATVTPEDATDKTVIWTSSNPNIASVDDTGKVTAIAKGEATIIASCGSHTAECVVTVVAKVIPVASISLDKETAEIKVEENFTLIATVLPENATDKSVTWTSSDPSIAVVDENGNVTGIAKGTASITASCGDLSDSCVVTVLPITVTSITLSANSLEMKVGDIDTLTATVFPENAEDKTIVWATSNEGIVTVTADGNITALAIGTATITATCGNVYASCLVTVVPTPAESVDLNPSKVELKVGENIVISASVNPSNASDKTIVWTASDPSIASVDATGMVTANAIGETTINAICGGISASCIVTVVSTPASTIELNPSKAELKVGESMSVTTTIYPETTTDKTVTWSSNHPEIASVDESGNITGNALGEAIITATCGNARAECAITVIPTPVTGIRLTNTTLLMRVGKTSELAAIIAPVDATDPTVTWTSDNESIAIVDANGLVTAIAIGNATITATSNSNPSVKATCYVTVEAVNDVVAVSKITISDKTLEMTEGDTYPLTATITPADATDPSLTWRSSDRTIATVDANGVVTAISQGEATIYVSSSNGLTEECAVTVRPNIIDPTGITLSNTQLLMREGYTSDLIAIVRPDNASDKTVVWSTSNPEIATVDNNGIVTAIKQGNCVITASTINGHKATCDVTVVPVVISVDDISLNKYELTMEINETFTLIATITPDDATDKTVTWKSYDKSIAVVSEYGVVTAVAAGTTTIYASSSNGKTVECIVTVLPGETAVASITLSQSELLMREGFTSELFAIIRPEDATDKTVFWSTSNPEIATVDENGVVTAIHQGNAVITATSANEMTAICNVTVVPYIISVEDISLNPTEIEIEVNDTYQLTATITPDDASDKTVTWRSLDRAIATVTEDGVVTGIGTGTTIIYASSSNGKTVECHVTVKPDIIDPTSISLTNTELLMIKGDTAELIGIVRPDNATDKTITWTSSDESIATVDNNGIVTAIQQGFATITASTSNGMVATCAVTVTIIPVESISLNKNKLELTVEDTETLIATITPDNATDKTVTWKSSNREVATVSENGLVTAIGVGTAIIYASSSNGLTAECEVTVNPGIIPVTGISLSNTELLMREGYSTDLLAIVRPDNATDKTVTWSTDNPAIATFDANGDKAIITANAVGTAIITVTSNFDPSIKAQCVVTVQKEEEIVAVESITLNKTELIMTEGDVEDLIATISPDDATDKSVTWKSSDREIATVDENGKVTAIKAGVATIYASSSNGLTAECAVTVNPAYVEVTSVSLTNTELLMREGHTADLIAIVRPDNATDKSITWASSDESIATVDQNGIVTAILRGNTTVTATSHNGIQAICYVTVVPDVVPVESIAVDPTSLEMEVEDKFTLTATITPDEATDKTVTWRSSDRAIATVSENGEVTAIGAGTAVIYASSSNGLTAECAVTVNPAYEEVISISLTNTELLMIEGDSTDLIAIIRPDNATDKSVTWTSSDESIVTVDQNGNVDAIKQGNAIVTATASNGVKAYCYVTVLPRIIAVESIAISDSEIDLTVGDEYTLTATISPDDATDKTITWKSSNRAIATVSENGLVTAIAEGTASIYASSSNGLTAECIVHVHPGIVEVESISLTNTELLMIEGDVTDIYAIVRPDNATDKTVVWTSSDEEIATVDQNGVVTAIKQGYTVVTATANNGVYANCYVTVVPVIIAVEDLIISKTELTMIEEDTYQLEAAVLPEDATDQTITWKTSDREVALVSENGLVTAVKMGTAIIYASSSNGLTKECHVTVKPLIIEVAGITLDPTSLTLAEGETDTLTASVTPENATDKTITWTSSNLQIATVEDGVVTGIKEGTATITAISNNGLTATCTVTVYSRPLTPNQLVRKGDGTTCTFVAMMGIPDAELTELGYRFVYGYNDAIGDAHIIADTPLRYCHTSSEIFNDPANDFWVFTLLEKDGMLRNSNLRHLDGSEEICFDSAKYGYSTKGDSSALATIESENWIEYTPNALIIKADGTEDTYLAIYNLTGIQVFARSYKSYTLETDMIDFKQFTPDTYVIVARRGGKTVSKKIVIR